MRRVLVLRRGGLGDTLLVAPVLRALRRRHPGAELWFAGVREFAGPLREHGLVDRVLSSEDLGLWAGERARWRLRELGVDAVYGDDAAVADHAFDVRAVDRGLPIGLSLARQLGLEPRWPEDAWLVPPRARRAGPLCLAPGSGSRTKCWPRERWLALARTVGERLPLQVLVGPTEIERDDVRRWPWPAAVEFVVEPDAGALARRLEGAAAFAGNDSGPTHLAAMLGLGTVALFGPSDPAIWAPVGPHVTVLRAPHGELAKIAAEEVATVLETVLAPALG